MAYCWYFYEYWLSKSSLLYPTKVYLYPFRPFLKNSNNRTKLFLVFFRSVLPSLLLLLFPPPVHAFLPLHPNSTLNNLYSTFPTRVQHFPLFSMCQTSEELLSATSRPDTVLCLRGIEGMWAGTGIRRSGFGGILVAGGCWCCVQMAVWLVYVWGWGVVMAKGCWAKHGCGNWCFLAGKMIGYGAIIGLAMGWGYWVVLVTEAGSCKKWFIIFLFGMLSESSG